MTQPWLLYSVAYGVPAQQPPLTAAFVLGAEPGCLDQLLALAARDPLLRRAELLLLDCRPARARQLADYAAELSWLYDLPFRLLLGREADYGAMLDAALSLASAPLLLLSTADLLPRHERWLEPLAERYAQTSEAGAISPLLLDLDERPLWPEGVAGQEAAFQVPAASARCLLLDRARGAACGSLAKFTQLEEATAELCRRLSESGYSHWAIPDVALYDLSVDLSFQHSIEVR